jgi:hypothetical protein
MSVSLIWEMEGGEEGRWGWEGEDKESRLNSQVPK